MLSGKSKGVYNLARKIKDVAKDQHVDWKQAYVEMRNFYKYSKQIEEEEAPGNIGVC